MNMVDINCGGHYIVDANCIRKHVSATTELELNILLKCILFYKDMLHKKII